MPSGAAGVSGACAVATGGLALQLALVGATVVLALAALLLASISRQVVLHHRVSERLRRLAHPAMLENHVVGLVAGIGTVVVAGIAHPRTYCSDDVATRLDADELRAVLLHERHHEIAHAPARLILLSALALVVNRCSRGSAWLERLRARIEIAADAHALRNGATRATLARAILKLNDGSPRLTLAGFTSASDLRLRALLGDASPPVAAKPRIVAWAMIGATLAVVACSLFALI